MFPTSSSHNSRTPAGAGAGENKRYSSGPASFLTAGVNGHTEFSVTGGNVFLSQTEPSRDQVQTTSFRLNELATAINGFKGTTEASSSSVNPTPPSPLLRHSSSPARFLNAVVSHNPNPNDGRFPRLGSQLNFTRTNSISQISKEADIVSSSIMFSSSPASHNKRARINVVNGHDLQNSELQFGLSETTLEAAAMDNLMDIPRDSVACKIRAKRGCATHPRSIAERERRTRISGKLKMLQDLVPNMDKQTSYADMLDLALQHIKGLQTHVQNIHKELQNCTCGCKNPSL